MFGQASLEYLVLSLVALSLLIVSLSALIAIKSSAERIVDSDLLLRSSAERLGNAISEVCAMGSGNIRTVSVEAPLSIETEALDDGDVIRFKNSDSSIVSHVLCPINPSSAQLKGSVIVENDGGEINIREQ